MAEGHLRCAGSSLFLKKMYGVGYQLTIEKNVAGYSKIVALNQRGVNVVCDVSEVLTDPLNPDEESQNRVVFDVDNDVFEEKPLGNGPANATLLSLVKCSVPEATLLNDVGTEVRYQLPIGSSDKFSAMFEQLDHEVDQGNIVSYGVSITTLGMYTCLFLLASCRMLLYVFVAYISF
jgi:ATP-binding cassette, subfamily A (ABC1), member 3